MAFTDILEFGAYRGYLEGIGISFICPIFANMKPLFLSSMTIYVQKLFFGSRLVKLSTVGSCLALLVSLPTTVCPHS